MSVNAVDATVSHYDFVKTEGRAEGIAIFEALFAWLDRRIVDHEEHSNAELLDATRDVAQRVQLGLDRLCEKWEESDRQGLTY